MMMMLMMMMIIIIIIINRSFKIIKCNLMSYPASSCLLL